MISSSAPGARQPGAPMPTKPLSKLILLLSVVTSATSPSSLVNGPLLLSLPRLQHAGDTSTSSSERQQSTTLLLWSGITALISSTAQRMNGAIQPPLVFWRVQLREQLTACPTAPRTALLLSLVQRTYITGWTLRCLTFPCHSYSMVIPWNPQSSPQMARNSHPARTTPFPDPTSFSSPNSFPPSSNLDRPPVLWPQTPNADRLLFIARGLLGRAQVLCLCHMLIFISLGWNFFVHRWQAVPTLNEPIHWYCEVISHCTMAVQ